ncbi:MAG: phosphoribosylamine--glycine ligase [Kiritimatiellae bacterium]|nr:phosphoribosylamine--glycine ligase [Kiritimatiellia bacterium]MDD5520034.1 phosphoribosylamine--glycine ligase [Kiritimatiellia bacterium]
MKILVIGEGGREHALAWKLSKDSCRPQVFCAPGNAGTAQVATNLAIKSDDIPNLLTWAKTNRPDLTVVGPEAPLCAGISDIFSSEGFRVFGPSKAAAQMEGSKVFSKDVMTVGGIPTATSRSFTLVEEALKYVRQQEFPLVIKAEGLAAGKGVVICTTVAEAEAAVRDMMVKKIFGWAGERILVEEFLEGEEASILALIDGKTVVMLASSQDHKRIFDDDKGPNTGGMGAYSPAPVVTDDLWPVIRKEVFERTLIELGKRGITYKGVLYAGLMIGKKGIKVLEFNCRFGDPETQAILPRIDGDLVPAFQACVDGTLSEKLIKWRHEACVCVVMASGGYPGSYNKGKAIDGVSDAEALGNVTVFHAGTKLDNGKVVTSGGRVLGVTALGSGLQAAVSNVYKAIEKIKFDKAHYRKDIAARALRKDTK